MGLEADNPQAELIRLQWLLEKNVDDPNYEGRRRLESRAAELIQQAEPAALGELARMPRLERLESYVHSIDPIAVCLTELPELRELWMSGFLGDPLPMLAGNESFRPLESLTLHP